ncbi:hypothetical protein A6F49_07765 [Enteractinococcus helveticum]|uniref:Uncharacterized protein n=1 Tax=Enteractinococcus helveticum TaxID=1837282 RepID=A0A1B7M0L6_9MICC|nr:hypothetical protein A6F49_07765 [Enteractinococcus helveticum]
MSPSPDGLVVSIKNATRLRSDLPTSEWLLSNLARRLACTNRFSRAYELTMSSAKISAVEFSDAYDLILHELRPSSNLVDQLFNERSVLRI